MSKFYTPTKYNGDTKNQMWMSTIADCHDMHCGCPSPFAHLLDSIFPEDHKDRHLTIHQIVTRDQQCLSGGRDEEDHGLVAGTSAATEDIKQKGTEDAEEDTLDALLIAAAEEQEKR